jgi:glutathionylspermidine synthase
LLEASFDSGHFADNFVSKPFLSREGCNIKVHHNGKITEYDGSYTDSGTVYQKRTTLPCFDGNYPVIGSWVIAGETAGIGIREDTSEVTTNSSRFVPHLFH